MVIYGDNTRECQAERLRSWLHSRFRRLAERPPNRPRKLLRRWWEVGRTCVGNQRCHHRSRWCNVSVPARPRRHERRWRVQIGPDRARAPRHRAARTRKRDGALRPEIASAGWGWRTRADRCSAPRFLQRRARRANHETLGCGNAPVDLIATARTRVELRRRVRAHDRWRRRPLRTCSRVRRRRSQPWPTGRRSSGHSGVAGSRPLLCVHGWRGVVRSSRIRLLWIWLAVVICLLGDDLRP